ncbi:MAG: glycosyltransferase family 9 protein [Nanoarchaeota archaeon]
MKICVIKLGALGDVVRTLPILEAIKKKYKDAEITWITKENALQLFEGNPFVKKVEKIPFKTQEEFGILYNLDIDDEATLLASLIKAKKKFGFYSENNYPIAFNSGAEYYLNTLFDDELKKSNKKTYQEMIFEASDIIYRKEKPEIYLAEREKRYAEEFFRKNRINKDKLIGIHMGAGQRWPSKAWSKEKIKEFIKKAKERSYEIIAFGGPDELSKIGLLVEELRKENISIYENNPRNSIKEFAALVSNCKKLVCSDSFALHIAIATNTPAVGLFFCTTPHEVEDYGLLKKVVSPILYNYFPERQNEYSEELVNSISADEVLFILENNNK